VTWWYREALRWYSGPVTIMVFDSAGGPTTRLACLAEGGLLSDVEPIVLGERVLLVYRGQPVLALLDAARDPTGDILVGLGPELAQYAVEH